MFRAWLKHTVILTSSNDIKGKEAVKKLEKEKLSVNFIKLDVTDPKQRSEAKNIRQIKTQLNDQLHCYLY